MEPKNLLLDMVSEAWLLILLLIRLLLGVTELSKKAFCNNENVLYPHCPLW